MNDLFTICIVNLLKRMTSTCPKCHVGGIIFFMHDLRQQIMCGGDICFQMLVQIPDDGADDVVKINLWISTYKCHQFHSKVLVWIQCLPHLRFYTNLFISSHVIFILWIRECFVISLAPDQTMKNRINLEDYFRKHWLLIGIIGCIFFAGIFPWLGSKEGRWML